MIPLLVGTLAGVGCGTISGLSPGIHANMIAGVLVGLSPLLLPILGTDGLSAVLMATLVTHTFLEIVPATFLGIPDAATAVSVLPAHAMTLAGKGEEAVRISALGSLYGVVFGLPLSLLAFFLIPKFQSWLDFLTGALLIFCMGVVIIYSESPGWALSVFLVSGLLGLFAFKYEYLCWNFLGSGSILMPLLSGLFGLAVICTAGQGSIPDQRFLGIRLSTREILKFSIPGTLSGLLVGWLPGLSTASANMVVSVFFRQSYQNSSIQPTFINTLISRTQDQRQYLAAVAAAGTANVIIGIAAFYAIGRMRNGIMVGIGSIGTPSYYLLISVSLIAAISAYLITVRSGSLAHIFSGLNTRRLNTVVAMVIIIFSLVLTGPFGIFILVLATSVGLVSHFVNISRISCMGAVTIPVILYSLGIGGF